MVKTLLVTGAVVLAAIAGTTYLALELGEVAIVETAQADGAGPRHTHVWYVRDGDVLFLDA